MTRARVLIRNAAVYACSMLLLLGSFSSMAFAQVNTLGRISGIVTDPQGAVISGADIVVKNDEIGSEYKAKSAEDGAFFVAGLPVAVYTVTVTAKGFKSTIVTGVKTTVGAATSVEIKLEVGAASETVTVTGGAEVLQRENTNVGSVITGRQITELPFTSRDALDLVLTLPGTATVGRPRSSSINGLPKGALYISTDGVNAQDNFLRTTDGFFTYIRPRIDAIEEVEVSTATPGAEASAGGAVHIRFVTKSGTNQYHGGAWWYNRQRAYNSNYYFNTIQRIRNAEGDLVETPRAQVMLNQWGFKVGGPITPWLKDRAFFFFSYEEFRLPEQQIRNRVILSPEAEAGIFRYPVTVNGVAQIRSVNMLQLAAAANNPSGIPSTLDPTTSGIISAIRESTSKGALINLTDPNQQQLTFTNTGSQLRRFPTARFDVEITNKHHFEAIYNFQDFASKVDFLNGRDPAFPEPVPQVLGSQGSNRFSLSTALRSQLGSTLVNEFRFGLTGGTVVFFPEMSPGSYDGAPFQGLTYTFPGAFANPHNAPNNSRRNSPIQQYTDNLSWAKGSHNWNFGGSVVRVQSFQQSSGGNLAPNLSFNILSADAANSIFTSGNFPGADATQINNARGIYALLVGKISQVNFNGKLDETDKTYSLDGTAVERNSTGSFGLYVQDYWKARPNLNLNYGIRWEVALSPRHNNGVYVRPTFNGLFGVSGPGGLFNPAANGGAATTYVAVDQNSKPFDADYNNFAPSLGFAWTPQFKSGLGKFLFGANDQSVIRGSYAISYVTGGFADFNGIWGNNPGLTQFAGKRAGIEFAAGTLLLRNGIGTLTPPPDPVFPLAAQPGVSAFEFDPNLRSPYVQSWSFGFQREINKDTVFEARYVGNHSIRLGQTFNLNEVNIFENGFLNEFKDAQNNLAIALANGRPANFRNQGLPGQVNLPIFTASFGSPTATQFGNATFIQLLQQGQAGGLANQLGNTTANIAFQNNRIAAGLSPNFFIVNPSLLGANSWLASDDGTSNYNALQIELRRRMSKGLLFSANYTWSHSLTNMFGSGGQIQPRTLRNREMDRGPSPFDIRHAFKLNYIYELPFGPGHKMNFNGGGNVISKILEGWQTDGIIRWQSGRAFYLTGGRNTVNQFDSGVELVGISQNDLQKLVRIRKDPAAANRGTVFWLPDNFILNTLRAFGLAPGTPDGPRLAPPSTPGKFGTFVPLYGPDFFRADLSIVKKTRITETANIEFRIEFLNAFNNTNFLVGNPFAGDVSNLDNYTVTTNSLNFGQTTHAYRDVSTTNDPGGRLLQLVLRVNF